MAGLKIVAVCVLAAVFYGIAHDNVTARVCVEYFTIGHPDLFGTADPTLLALGWGVVATWWMGAILGVPLALLCRLGHRPKLGAGDVLRPIARLLGVMAVLSLAAGLLAYALGDSIGLGEMIRRRWDFSAETSRRFATDLVAHNVAYATGFLGGILVWVWAWRRRGALARARVPDDAGVPPRPPAGLPAAGTGE